MGEALFRRNKKYIIVVLIVLVLLVAIYFSAVNRENTLFYDNAVSFVSRPVSQFMTFVGNKFGDFFDYFKDKKRLVEENVALTDQVTELEHKNAQLSSYEAENERLRNMLDLKGKNPQFDLIASSVISKDNSNYYGTFLIDKGANHGIATNMAVMGTKGLIGYVIETGTNWAKIQTMIDGGSSAGCMVTRTKSVAVTNGTTALLNEGLLSMLYISKDMSIVEGDIIETSGLGQIYPSGIMIGRVKELRKDDSTQSQYAIIQPVEDFENIKEVFVIAKTLE